MIFSNTKINIIKKFISFLVGYDLSEEFWKDYESIFISAFVHKSCDCSIPDYDRLEVIGDSVISLVVTDNLYRMGLSVGDISNRRKEIVSGTSLSWMSKKLEMHKYLLVGKGCDITDSILEDIYESLMGAFYISLGYAETKKIIDKTLINSYLSGELIFSIDYKTQFQELIQKDCKSKKIRYFVEGKSKHESGKDIFHVNVSNNGHILGRGQGFKVKDAEQNAAKNALLKLEIL